EIAVDAESLSYDQEANTLTARGGVTLKRGDTTLTADEVVYDRTRGIAEASGHVVLTDPQATMEGDFAHLNLDDESGWFDNATADVETAARVGLLGEYRYFLSRQAHGSFGGAYYNEQIRGTSQGTVTTTGEPANIPENRFVITGHHVQPFYWKSRFYLDLFAV